jgi:hypothetical protein
MRSSMSYFFSAVAKVGIINLDNVLQLAARKGQTAAARASLQAGADIHILNDAALRLAAYWGRIETAKFLLENGADVHAKDDEAIRWARRHKNPKMESLIQEWVERTPRNSQAVPNP